jgi:ABC-2 type transport system ATP-binding protein
MIEVSGLVKDFGDSRVVDKLEFDVPKGQILGFLGPNGAGKSTTMKMLTCFLEPTAGTARIGGKDILKDSLAVRRQIGYLPESAPTYNEMTVREFLEFIAEVRGKRGQARIVAAERVREKCFLKGVWNQPIETLSKGYRQRVGFAQALIHDPPVLILDEPTDGLDPNQKHEVRQLISGMANDKTIILSTHILEEVEAICHRVVIIANGKMVADSSPEKLLEQSSSHNAVVVRFSKDEAASAKSILEGVSGVNRVEAVTSAPNSLRIFSANGKPIVQDVSEVVRNEKWALEELFVEQGRLDEVFRKVTLS